MLSCSLFDFEFRKHNPAVMCFRGGVLVYNRDINKGERERGFPPLTTVNQHGKQSLRFNVVQRRYGKLCK